MLLVIVLFIISAKWIYFLCIEADKVELVLTEYRGHGTYLAQNSLSHVIIAAGGDGLVNEVARGIVNTDKFFSNTDIALIVGDKSFEYSFTYNAIWESITLSSISWAYFLQNDNAFSLLL